MGYKAIISYFKSRRFRKQDKELEEIKIELKRLKGKFILLEIACMLNATV